MRNLTTTSILAGAGVGVLAAALLIAFGPRNIPLASDRTGDARIASFFADHAEKGHHQLAGFIYDNGEVTFGGLGADEHTEFEIGSVTKTFNAELVRQLIEEGSITLETTVADIIGNTGGEVDDVTLEELLNHTSGLKRLESISWYEALLSDIRDGGNPYRRQSAQDILDAAGNAKLDGRGEENYSNYGHALLGQLLAARTGVEYEELLRTRIFEPAGMTETFLSTPGRAGGLRRGLWSTGLPIEPWDMDGWAPAGAIRSTPYDMAKYVEWVAEHGRPEYGWITEADDPTYTFHNGGTFGFSSMLVWDREDPHRAAYVSGDSFKPVDDLGVGLLEVIS
ncbi:Penicillin-binding protein 4* [Corynebacterium glaucum]|uniref:Penicillin-binding protein 4 n=1 Tax=Corynebacterium glaucum TaxID=187491 RepID=A0A1Q2HW46_9CORY|nr:serine hydrolase domain-containing protein [Corynebacterium glaucum]AQQ15068.1 Penicillin-binding protein 4* [Corynebacterium glaucum]